MTKRALILIAVCALSGGCRDGALSEPAVGSSSSQPPVAAPPPTAPAPPAEKLDSERSGPLVTREYIAQILSEVFASATYNATVNNEIYGFAGQKNQLGKPSVFGVGCDTYGSSYNLDCEGDVAAGSMAPVMAGASAVRQLTKLKLCEQLVSKANSPKAVAEKIGALSSGALTELTSSNVSEMFGLFFRAREIRPAELDAYLRFNDSLKASGVNLTDRWRALLTIMCESPEWEVL